MIDIRQLQLFVAVAEELHFGRAAARIGMAQPPFSQQIRRIERDLGVALLNRTSRRVSLTAAGATLLDEARGLIARRERLVDLVRRTASGDAGSLRIGFSASSAVGILPPVVRALRAALPDVALHIDDRDGIDVAAAVRAGTLDAAIVRAPFAADGLAVETLHRDRFVAVLPASHPLARREEVAPADLSGNGFVMFPRASAPGFHDSIVGLCAAAGFSPVIVQEAGAWLSVVGLVESGLGITIAPATAARACPPGVALVPLADTDVSAELVVVHRRGGPNPLVARFLDLARAAVARG